MLDIDQVIPLLVDANDDSFYLERFQQDIEEIEFFLLRQVKSNKIVTPERVDISAITSLLKGCGNFGQQIINRSRKLNIDRVAEIQKLTADASTLENAIAEKRSQQTRVSSEREIQRRRINALADAYADIVENNDLSAYERCVDILKDDQTRDLFVKKCRGTLPAPGWGEQISSNIARLRGKFTRRQDADFVYTKFLIMLEFVLKHCRSSGTLSEAARDFEKTRSTSVICSSIKEEFVGDTVTRLLRTHDAIEMVESLLMFCRYLKSAVSSTIVKPAAGSDGDSLQTLIADHGIIREMLAQAQQNSRWEKRLCDFSQYKFTVSNLADLYEMHRSLDVKDLAEFVVVTVALFNTHIPVYQYGRIREFAKTILRKEHQISYQDISVMVVNQIGE